MADKGQMICCVHQAGVLDYYDVPTTAATIGPPHPQLLDVAKHYTTDSIVS